MLGDGKVRRCAIYTRKSSEEGLEQEFNSLDAQREACASFVASQKHEGWVPIAEQYDDGGYSGGTMERPALLRLLGDIQGGHVDVVVVYKVDRLSRALSDFAKMVEIFDGKGVSFVSVTQQFNTTTSMGRLTLNVLLSFAQFEREVTGERIRDKFAASRKKGMWMGGTVPLGYDLKERKLVINEEEADLVRTIFGRYLEMGCVATLRVALNAVGATSKRRVSKAGKISGGVPFTRGALYNILNNRVYIGEAVHKGTSYPGQQEAIIDQDLWKRVHRQLAENKVGKRNGEYAKEPSLLTGTLFDDQGNRLTPSHAVKNGKRYRYYVGQSGPSGGRGLRLPAHDIEAVVSNRLIALLKDSGELLGIVGVGMEPARQQRFLEAAHAKVDGWSTLEPSERKRFVQAVTKRVTVGESEVRIEISPAGLRYVLIGEALGNDEETVVVTVRARIRRSGSGIKLVIETGPAGVKTSTHNTALIKAVARSHVWYQKLLTGERGSIREIARASGFTERYVGRIARLAFLAPDIVEAILDGRQPADLTVEMIWKNPPRDWAEQRKAFGFAA